MRSFSTVFIDLDQTIYPSSSGIWEDVADRINTYLELELKLTPQQALELRRRFYRTYGTTLRGLQHEASVDPIGYMEFIHDVPIEQKIPSDPDLPGLLTSITVPKYIFTNASIDHAERVLRHLKIENCFDGIIDIIRLAYFNKPDAEAYRRALELAGDPAPQDCVLLDDSLKNLRAGSRMGMTTVHVGTNQDEEFTPDHQIATIHDVLEVLPELNSSHHRTGMRDG